MRCTTQMRRTMSLLCVSSGNSRHLTRQLALTADGPTFCAGLNMSASGSPLTRANVVAAEMSESALAGTPIDVAPYRCAMRCRPF